MTVDPAAHDGRVRCATLMGVADSAGPDSATPGFGAASPAAPVVAPVKEPVDESVPKFDRPWKVIVWDDPVNLMSYVTFVLRKLFGYSQDKAHRLMMQVHTEGKAVVTSGPKEKAEHYVFQLHDHGLWATMEQDR